MNWFGGGHIICSYAVHLRGKPFGALEKITPGVVEIAWYCFKLDWNERFPDSSGLGVNADEEKMSILNVTDFYC
jgi:hypothetical protein